MRLTVPRALLELRSRTFVRDHALAGRARRRSGLLVLARARCLVGVGHGVALRLSSTASPERAAQAAAGIANSALLARVRRTTSADGLARARPRRSGRSRRRARRGRRPRSPPSCSRSGAAALVADADHLRVLRQVGAARLRGWSSVSAVTAGRSLAVGEQDRRADRRARQHGGRDRGLPVVLVHEHHGGGPVGLARGREDARCATPAASAAASPPPTRIVLLVAVAGKPSFSAACSSLGRGARACRARGRRRRGCSRRARAAPAARVAQESAHARRTIAGGAAIAAARPGADRRALCQLLVGHTIDWSVNAVPEAPHDGFPAHRRAARVPGALPQVRRARSSGPSPPSTTASRACRGRSSRRRASGTSTGSTTSSGWRSDPDGLFGVHLRRGAALGLRRHRARDLGLLAGRRRHRRRPARPSRSAAGCPSASATGDEIKLGAYAVTEAGAGSDVKSLRTTAKRDGDEWVLNGTKVFISNGGIADVTVVVATVDPELGHRGQASFVVPKDTPGLSHGQEGGQARHPRLADRRGRARGLPHPDGLPARRRRRSSRRSSSAPARASAPAAPPARSRRSRSRARWSAPRRSASRRPPTSGRSSTSRAQRRGRRAAARAAAHPAGAGRRGDRDRGRAPARVARRLDGPQRRADDRRPGLDVQAQGRRRGDVGDDHADGPGRRPTRSPPTARSRSGSATRRSTRSSRARPRSSGWSSRACSAPSTSAGSRRPPRCSSRRRARARRPVAA